MVKLPCEDAIWYVLPQIRADLAKELVKGGISQKEAAERLGITASAVSQYLHKKRGINKDLSEDYNKMISEAARQLRSGGSDEVLSRLLCQCCAKRRGKPAN
jgi:uncharacterized protein